MNQKREEETEKSSARKETGYVRIDRWAFRAKLGSSAASSMMFELQSPHKLQGSQSAALSPRGIVKQSQIQITA